MASVQIELALHARDVGLVEATMLREYVPIRADGRLLLLDGLGPVAILSVPRGNRLERLARPGKSIRDGIFDPSITVSLGGVALGAAGLDGGGVTPELTAPRRRFKKAWHASRLGQGAARLP